MITVRSIGFKSNDGESLKGLKKRAFKNLDDDGRINDVLVEDTLCYKKWKPAIQKLQITLSFKNILRPAIKDDRTCGLGIREVSDQTSSPIRSPPLAGCDDHQLENAAATKLQKAYKSYRTRRNLADCAVVIEELWWKALDFAALRRSSISFFDSDKSETAVSRWARARTRVAKLGKGLSKDEKAQQLALRHWLEVIDPRHRYGHNLHLYYDVWFASRSSQPFFYWLDVGDGKEINLQTCPRTLLQRQCIKYLGPKEREAYEVIVAEGKLVYRQSGKPVETVEGTKWIFVLSASRILYVGQKEKGLFQHSSFLAGAAAIAAGRLIAHDGLLQAIWSYSGHYRPTEENFLEFISFLEDQNVDLTDVKKCPMDDDIPPPKRTEEEPKLVFVSGAQKMDVNQVGGEEMKTNAISHTYSINEEKVDGGMADEANTEGEATLLKAATNTKPIICKWGGTRIGCVKEYPTKLQLQALEHVNLSPRNVAAPSFSSCGPIPSPRPSPKIYLSHTFAHMGLLQSSTLDLSDPK